MPKQSKTAEMTRNQPARRVKRAMSTIERPAVVNSPRNQPARRMNRVASTIAESNVTCREFAVARNRKGTQYTPSTHT